MIRPRSKRSGFKGLAAATLVAVLSLPLLGAVAGKPAPQFNLPSKDGKTVSLAQYKGQVVMINFWASWCHPCRDEMPLLENIYKQYNKLGFVLLGVNVEPDSKAADGFLTALKSPVTFPVLYDRDSKVSQEFSVASMPSTVIVDRKGNVRMLHLGYKPGDEQEYMNSIRQLVRE